MKNKIIDKTYFITKKLVEVFLVIWGLKLFGIRVNFAKYDDYYSDVLPQLNAINSILKRYSLKNTESNNLFFLEINALGFILDNLSLKITNWNILMHKINTQIKNSNDFFDMQDIISTNNGNLVRQLNMTEIAYAEKKLYKIKHFQVLDCHLNKKIRVNIEKVIDKARKNRYVSLRNLEIANKIKSCYVNDTSYEI